MLAGSFVVTVAAFIDLLGTPAEERSHVVTLFEWLPVGNLQVDIAFLADPLSIAMCLFVTGVGTLIHVYAIGYMHGDPKFSKFFCYLNLFAFSMLVLVLGENMLVTFLGWEGVGHLLVPARSRSGTPASRRRPPARRRSSPTGSATGASWWRCSSPSAPSGR